MRGKATGRGLWELPSSLGPLGHPAHLGADVPEEEEGSRAGCADYFSHPEGYAPAVVLGDGAEGQPSQKATHCREQEGGASVTGGMSRGPAPASTWSMWG